MTDVAVDITGPDSYIEFGSLLAIGDGVAAFDSPDLVMDQGALWFRLQSPIKIKGIAAAIEEGAPVVGTNARATLHDPANNRRIQFSAGTLTIARGAIAIPFFSVFFSVMRIRTGTVHVSTAGSPALSGIGMTAAAGSLVPFSAAVVHGVGMSIRAGVLAPFSKGIVTSSDSPVDIVEGADAAVQCISMADSVITTVTAGNE